MKYKTSTAIILAVLLTLLLAGCGSPNESGSADTTQTNKTEKVAKEAEEAHE